MLLQIWAHERDLYLVPIPPRIYIVPPLLQITKIVHNQLVSDPTSLQEYINIQYISLGICYLHSNTKIIDIFMVKNS